MKDTDLIFRELSPEEIAQKKPFSHFGWEGTDAFSFYVISDGYWNCAKFLMVKMKENGNNFALVDSLIYPLFYNYRHSIETYLKQLFFNCGDQSEYARSKFLKIGHNLWLLWTKLRPFLEQGKKHVGTPIELNIIEHYIKEINDFDPDSMVMRYPITKKLSANKSKEYRFDFIYFGDRMNELCETLRQLNNDLSNQMKEAATLVELDEYLNYLKKYHSKIDEFIKILKKDSERKTFKIESIETILDLEPSPTQLFLHKCEPDLLILLDNLFYGGQCINTNNPRLSISFEERQKEFVKLCNTILKYHGLRFGSPPDKSQINIYSKSPSIILKNIATAISILD